MANDLLPHGDAFLFLDHIDEASEDEVVGTFTFCRDHKVFGSGHAGGIVPQVLLVESMVQCGSAGVRQLKGLSGVYGLAKIEEVEFLRPVHFDLKITFRIKNTKSGNAIIRQHGTGYVSGEVVMKASWISKRLKTK
ncbi:MAG: hypothetical protein RIG77_11205 [Cyclobacteriaceae bacterium]